ncbi:hypothetical protein A1O1_01945 [Capronia coronata CBS 617.96]|uniref:DUF7728 domain-containing protein n=1 Tax=Capronia coronata CBS 617.96 TaxID=1182541 RepID=W9YLW8_9EURO|nr:uncharacterized protein A1O1_01945 [Capronia coronata CBS 617.96]EXJ93553.1 hypothetical protein A1O1_01945 [Capronia coronata CBS 617.96]
MHLTSALLVGAWALEASAFLVPLEISKAAQQAKSELAALLAKPAHAVDLDCPGCPFFGVDDTTALQYDVENRIHLELEVDSDQTLTVNGFPVMPKDAATPFDPVMAPQIRVEDGEQTAPIQLDYAYERLPPVASADEPDMSILPVRLTILGLQGQPVKVDTLEIDLVQSPDQTSIARVSAIPFEETPGATTCDTSPRWSLCRLRAIIAARLQTIMESAKAHAHAAKGWVGRKGCKGKKFGEKGMNHGEAHGHGHGHGHHMGGHHHSLHHFGLMLHQTLRFFIIPALLGVIGGLMASAIGMLLGQLISFLWIKYRRNSQPRHRDVRVVEIVVDEEEKDALLIDSELPPPPQYEDVEANNGEVINDEKN